MLASKASWKEVMPYFCTMLIGALALVAVAKISAPGGEANGQRQQKAQAPIARQTVATKEVAASSTP